jgi:tRNA threonylcarbamoyladenosine modification (KEOPS) complex  Pcc1 subunit
MQVAAKSYSALKKSTNITLKLVKLKTAIINCIFSQNRIITHGKIHHQ